MRLDAGSLGRDDLVLLLTEVGAELERQGIRGDLLVIGGAALALAYDMRRTTRDIDGVFEPKQRIYAAAAVVADRHQLEADWLNDAAEALVPPGAETGARVVLDVPGLTVSVPAPEKLLALKVASARVDRDADDIVLLARLCGLSDARAILDLTERVIGASRPLAPKVQYLVEDLFGPLDVDPVQDDPTP